MEARKAPLRLLMLLLLILGMAVTGTLAKRKTSRSASQMLSTTYYDWSCPNASRIIFNTLNKWYRRDKTICPAIIRLHFHDCAVRGCDASILLDHPGSERDAEVSRTLRGFQVIDDIKRELERSCPRTVSCSDILFVAARDATLLLGGPFWDVPMGRKDGYVSIAKEADAVVPRGTESVSTLLRFFQSKGLNILDLVSLSGVHTIGQCECRTIKDRLYNFNKTGKPDPSMNRTLLYNLRSQCKYGWKSNRKQVYLDNTTPTKFDNVYYQNTEKHKGVLLTDQRLADDSRTSGFVQMFAGNSDLFSQQFAVSMIKLGEVQILVGGEGEVRTNCSVINKK